MPPALDPQIKQLTNAIVSGYQPEKIILFGSRASGRSGPDSDIDLLVIKNTTDRYWDRIHKIVPLLRGMPSVDLFVLTPTELDKSIADNRYFLTKEILPKGITLYDRAP